MEQETKENQSKTIKQMMADHKLFWPLGVAIVLITIGGSVSSVLTRQHDLDIRKIYQTLGQAFDNNDYHKYRSNYKSVPENFSSLFSPYSYLELDLSVGGGGGCCDKPSSLAYVDIVNNIAWIRDSNGQFGFDSIQWYGPFKILELKKGAERCESLDSGRKDRCYSHEAVQGARPDLCEKIIVSDTKDKCFNTLGYDLGRLDLCDMISNIQYRGYCYREVAQYKLHDEKICDKIEDVSEKEFCHRSWSKN